MDKLLKELVVTRLMKQNSKNNIIDVRQWAIEDPARTNALFLLLEDKDVRVKKRAAWVISHFDGEHIQENWTLLLDAAEKPGATDGVKRAALRILQTHLPEEELLGRVWDFAFRMAAKRDEAIAVRAFAFGTLERICLVFPELKPELMELARQEKPYTQKGLLNRIDRVLKENFRQPSKQ